MPVKQIKSCDLRNLEELTKTAKAMKSTCSSKEWLLCSQIAPGPMARMTGGSGRHLAPLFTMIRKENTNIVPFECFVLDGT